MQMGHLPLPGGHPALSFAYAERNPPKFFPFPSVLALLCHSEALNHLFSYSSTLSKKECPQNLPTLHIFRPLSETRQPSLTASRCGRQKAPILPVLYSGPFARNDLPALPTCQ